jgi:chitodextrinase
VPDELQSITVSAVNSSGETVSDARSVTTLPHLSVPSNLSASNISSSEFRLSWSTIDGATSYRVLTNDASPVTVTAPYCVKQGLSGDTDYSMTVVAVDSTGSSRPSDPLVVRTSIGSPAAPANLRVSAITNNAFRVTWDTVYSASGYKIYLTDANANSGQQFLYGNASTNTMLISGRLANTQYGIAVTAINIAGESSQSTMVVFTATDSPQDLTCTADKNSLYVAWSGVLGAVSYKIVINDMLPVMVTSTSYNKTNLSPNTAYTVSVTAVNSDGNESVANTIGANTLADVPDAPQQLSVLMLTTESFQINWGAVSSAVSYNVYLNDVLYENTGGAETFSDITGLQSGTSYNIDIETVNQDNVTSLKTRKTVVTLPQSPSFEISRDNDAFLMTWLKVNGAGGYRVYYKTNDASSVFNGVGLCLNSLDDARPSPVVVNMSDLIDIDDTHVGVRFLGAEEGQPYWFGLSTLNSASAEGELKIGKTNITYSAEAGATSPVLNVPNKMMPLISKNNRGITIRWQS